jgi:DNA-binding MarR family transcriptional regulator
LAEVNTQRLLELAEEFFRRAHNRLPLVWLQTDLTMPQLRVLYLLYMDGPQSCGALGSSVDLSLPTMTGILDRLERRGYLKRDRDREDARRVISTISAKGTKLVDRLWSAGLEGLADVFGGVEGENLRTVERALEILNEAFGPVERWPEPAIAGEEDA